jgi:ATP-binding cassette, subfamily B, bacterial
MESDKPNTKILLPVLRHFWLFIRNHIPGTITLLLGYALAIGLASLLLPLLYKEIIDIVIGSDVALREDLFRIVLYVALAILAYNFLFRLADYVLLRVQLGTLKEASDNAMAKLTQHSYAYFAGEYVGSIVSKTRRYVNAFETLQDQVVFNITMNSVTLVGAVAILFYQAPVLGLAFMGWFILYCVLIFILVRIQVPKTAAVAEADSAVGARYADTITNILTVKMFGAEKRETKQFEHTTEKHRALRHHALMQEVFWNGIIQGVLIGVFNVAMLWITIELWLDGVISAGTIVLVQLYVMSSFDMVWRMSRDIVRVSAALTDAHEMVQILERPLDVEDKAVTIPLRVTDGAVTFSHVSFGYGEDTSVIHDLDLAIRPGEKVALVGHSGAGKTTMVKLLLRFVDPTSGAVLIDGTDIRDVPQTELRKHIAYVPQEPLLFHRSIYENIAYGKTDATKEQIEDVARKAKVHEFVERIPEGYESLVGERGVKLSGGERQRIAIARAMLKDAPIVLLDEATSSLDSISEHMIQQAFEALMEGRTTIAVAHRLSTIRHMDRIIVLEHGTVVEQGDHATLLARRAFTPNFGTPRLGDSLRSRAVPRERDSI